MNPRWIVVAGSPFMPAQDGGEREHLGFVESMVDAGWLAALVVPTDNDPAAWGREDDLQAIRDLIAPAPLFVTPRRRSLPAAIRLAKPYVVASRPAPHDLAARVGMLVPDANGVLIFAMKSVDIGRMLAVNLGLPAVLRQHNLEGPYHRALAGSLRPPKSWVVQLEAARIDRADRKLEHSAWLHGIADISATDAAVRRDRSNVAVVHVPTFALGPRASRPSLAWQPASSPVVVFVGALHVGTNHDAIEWFAEHVWPQVRSRHPQARWQIVGRSPSERVHTLVARTGGAELHADVPDPRTFLREASVAINPTVSGSGVNIKLVEYLSVGVPVVSTTKGQAGLGVLPQHDLLVADSPGEFAGAVNRLLEDSDLADRVGGAGLATAERILDVGRSLELMRDLMGPSPDRG